MVQKKAGLGRGLDALLPTNFDTVSVLQTDRNGAREIEVRFISPKLNQPRTVFDDEKIEQLSYSIREHGILQPLVLVEESLDAYTIIAGERRYRAALLAGLDKVPAIVRTASELAQLEIALIENMQREDLTPLEQAAGIKRLREDFSQAYEQIAKKLGKAESTVINLSRLLQLPTACQEALRDRKITEGHARSLLVLNDQPEAQMELLKLIISKGWNVRQAELYAKSYKEEKGQTRKVAAKMQQETPETKRIAKRLGAPVQIKRKAKGGTLLISFKDDNDLSRLLGQL